VTWNFQKIVLGFQMWDLFTWHRNSTGVVSKNCRQSILPFRT